MKASYSRFWRSIGPGLLFSGTAIGVSHLVQSTRAGAVYGLALAGVILLACLLKYPSFRFGVDFAHATGRTLYSGYREIGKWALVLIVLTSIPFIPVGLAAISATTAGLIAAITNVPLGVPLVATMLLVISAILTICGGYQWLDQVNRALLAFLVLATLVTTLTVLPQTPWESALDVSWTVDPAALIFIVALVGWMPAPVGSSFAQSLWTRNYYESVEQSTEPKDNLIEARFAFLVPYVMTTVLALCFCIMGASVMHTADVVPAQDAVGFAVQVIDLYREALGNEIALLASIAAASTMLTTLFTSVDATGRTFATMIAELAGADREKEDAMFLPLMLLSVGSGMVFLFFFEASFLILVDFATAVAFIAAPLVTTLNHVVITRCDIDDAARPNLRIQGLNVFATLMMTGLAIAYFVHR